MNKSQDTNSNFQTNSKMRVALIAAQWHEDLVNVAISSCQEELSKLGVAVSSNVQLFKVPGSLEIPLTAKLLAKTGNWDGVIAFGLVVDGGIYRHEFVAQTVLDGMMNVALDAEVPILSAVLTPQKFDEHDTAQVEFFRKHLVTKGAEAARAAVQTIQLTWLIKKSYSKK